MNALPEDAPKKPATEGFDAELVDEDHLADDDSADWEWEVGEESEAEIAARRVARKEFEAFRGYARHVSEAENLAYLAAAGFDVAPDRLEALLLRHSCAFAAVEAHLAGQPAPLDEKFRLTAALDAWRVRVRPDLPMLDELHDLELRRQGEPLAPAEEVAAMRRYFAVVRAVAERLGTKSLVELDDAAPYLEKIGRQTWEEFGYLDQWFDDEGEGSEGLPAELAAIAEWALAHGPWPDEHKFDFEMTLAEMSIRLGRAEEGERILERLAAVRPHWELLWLCWADAYRKAPPEHRNPTRAAEIAERAVPLLDRPDGLLEFAARMREELGDRQAADAHRRALRVLQEAERAELEATWRDPSLRLNRPAPSPVPSPTAPLAPAGQVDPSGKRVGRNDPCPCGSGKKFKKCCG